MRPLITLLTAALLLVTTGAIVLAQTVAGPTPLTQQKTMVTPLERGKPNERELTGDQAHSYSIALMGDQYLRVVVDQRGIDVVVTLFSPDARKLAEVDSPNGTQGPEPISTIVEAAGSYRLEVRSLEKTAAAGRYAVKLEELRTATAQDKSRIAAEQAFMQAELLRAQGTAESLKSAIKKYEESLPLSRSVGDSRLEVMTLDSIGVVYDSLGDKQKALDFFNQSLPLTRAAGDRNSEATALNNIGVAYDNLGEKQKALDAFNQALPLRRAVGDRNGEGTTLSNLGLVYYDLGENQRALDYYNQSLPLKREVGDRRGEAITLINIGSVYYSLGEKQKALTYFHQSLALRRAVGDRGGEAITLNNIGLVYHSLGEEQKALDFYKQSLPLNREAGDRGEEAITLDNIGEVYHSLGEEQKALDFYNQSLPLSRAVGDRTGEALTLANVARVERDRGNLTEARARIEAALTIFESLRTKIASQELRASYFATVQGYYDFYIDLLMRLHQQQPSEGHDGAALQMSERARARSLLEYLAEANADIRQGVDAGLLERERSLQRQLNATAQQQTRLLSGRHTKEEADAIAKEIDALANEFQQTATQIRQTSPRYAAIMQPQPLSAEEIRAQVLDTDTLLLQYSLGTDRSYLWAMTPLAIKSYQLPKRAEIETAAKRVYQLLNARNQRLQGETKPQRQARVGQADSDYPAAAAALSKMILGPVAAELGRKRLLIVADGALLYIPFAALPEPAQTSSGKALPLVESHEIVSLPSASTLAILRREQKDRRPATKVIAVLADPVFAAKDDRVKTSLKQPLKTDNQPGNPVMQTALASGPETSASRQLVHAQVAKSAQESNATDSELRIARLRATRREAEEIVALVPAPGRKLALDFAANRATATAADLADYRYVHFATHGLLNSTHPELSGIVLSLVNEKGEPEDGFLRAHEVFNLKLSADLVVLSACQTGLGKEVRGEGLVSLTRGFMYAGTPRVVVSLWSVDDEATASLMVSFYKAILSGKMTPASALQAAQIESRKQNRWANPFYWAAFSIQGEWR